MNIIMLIILLTSALVSSLDDLIKQMEKGVEYHLYTRKNPYGTINFYEDNMHDINKNTPVKVIIHGRVSNNRFKFIQDMTAEYLKKGDYNVIQVNWERFAFASHPVVASRSSLLGTVIGRFLAKLHDNKKLLPSNIHLIGHSLGAHVCGHVGNEFFFLTGSKVSRITGLDPPAALYETEFVITKEMFKQCSPVNEPLHIYRSLQSTDADIVDVMHTDRCRTGIMRRMGTVDFYPNGAVFQPGCPLTCNYSDPSVPDMIASLCLGCNHLMSGVYFIESINNRKFISTKCTSWNSYNNGKCKNNLKILMGDDYEYFSEATGKFFLAVNLNESCLQNV